MAPTNAQTALLAAAHFCGEENSTPDQVTEVAAQWTGWLDAHDRASR
jgi:hypothetical protein